MTDIKKNIGKNIGLFRKKLGLSQEDLAGALGLSRASIMNIESGRHSPSLDKFIKICAVIKCEYSDILPIIPQVDLREKEVKIIKRKTKIVSAKFSYPAIVL